MSFFIYILHSSSSGRFYVGHSEDPKKRLLEHNHSNFLTYTSKFRPWRTVALFKVIGTRSEALRIERFIKNQKSKKLILQLIDTDYLPTGSLAQLVQIPYLQD